MYFFFTKRFPNPLLNEQSLKVEFKALEASSLLKNDKLTLSEKVKVIARKGNGRRKFLEQHTCCLCQKVFLHRGSLYVHLKNIHLKTPCSTAKKKKITPTSSKTGNEFYKNLSLKALISKGNEQLRPRDPHTCFICKKVFANRYNLENHIRNVHHVSKKMFCDLCPEIFFSKGLLYRHMQEVHCNKRFACNVCDYKSVNKTFYQNHMALHNAKQECPICKKFVPSLANHKRVHEPKKCCSVCQKMVRRRYMKEHMNIHEQRRYKCKSCGNDFETVEDLRW